jgi:hypothetical protein
MRRSLALLAAALLPALAQGCTGETIQPVITPVAADERRLTITLDQCGCATCRVAVRDLESGRVIHSEIDPPLGVAVVAAACYAGPTAAVILECGNCAGGSACTAAATLVAGGLPAGQASCDTAAQAGASCTETEELIVDGSPVNPDCEP